MMKVNLKQIAEGYYNLFVKGTIISSDTIEHLANLRLKECVKCENYDTSGESCTNIIDKTFKNPCCKLCGCNMNVKRRVLEATCPDKENSKW